MKPTETSDILEAINSVVGSYSPDHPCVLHEPSFRGTKAWNYVKDCLDTGWVSSAGKWVSRFEESICDATQARHAVAVTNGTVALRLSLHLIGVLPGDEVLIPPLTFVATANAVSHLGAVPHFIDIEPTTLGVDHSTLARYLERILILRNGVPFNKTTGRRIGCLVPVHIFGHPADLPSLSSVASKWNIPVIEDAAEALGSTRGSIHCGLFGLLGTLSFNGNKLITTGGGGAIITNSDHLAVKLRHLSTTAKKPHPWEYDHDAIAWNDRLPNLNAALGVAQLENLSDILSAKKSLCLRYQKAFSAFSDIEIIEQPFGCSSNYWLITLRFLDPDPQHASRRRLQLLEAALSGGLYLRPSWKLLNTLPMYESCPSAPLPVANDQSNRLLNLPSSPSLISTPNSLARQYHKHSMAPTLYDAPQR